MRTSKRSATLIITVLAVVAASIGAFAYRNLRGVAPAVLPPPRDITQELPAAAEPNATGIPLVLPPNTSIGIFARDLGQPRDLEWGPDGVLLVSIPSQGRVVAFRDRDGDGVAEERTNVLTGLNRPHGIAVRCVPDPEQCRLYIAETDALAVYDYDRAAHRGVNRRALLTLPGGGNHWTRSLLFRPAPDDHELLVSIGSSCNVCVEGDERRAAVLAVDVTTGAARTFARGLRNSVFLAIHPITGAIWATEMGRDLLGDDLPPDEVNILGESADYGWPFCYGKGIRDPFGAVRTDIRCEGDTPSHMDLPAHVAPLGLAFIPEEGWPEAWWHNLLIAEHGSWNRSIPVGYQIVRYDLDAQGNAQDTVPFITGWLEGNRALGRPVDILIQPGGTMYVSDDKAGVIYRITVRADA